MKKSLFFAVVFALLTVLANGCTPVSTPVPTPVPPTPVPPTLTPSLVPPTSTPEPTATVTPAAWETYTNETWGFSLERPADWAVLDINPKSGLMGKQVFWWVGDYDPTKQPGDRPAVDQITDISIAEQPAQRMLGHYLGAMGGMGLQQYLRYVIQKGDVFYMFVLCAVDVNGVPADMMNETLPLREEDTARFEQMMATLKFR